MDFNSLQYGVFLVVVYFLYLSLRHQAQNRLLLVASYLFYAAWDWRFLSLIMLSTTVDYFCGLRIDGTDDKAIRRRFMWISVATNISILGFFKYFNFFVDNFIALFGLFGIELTYNFWQIVLPVGISFYTFQTMSYTIDIYRKQVKPANNWFDYALYVSFFPQLVAGPIERGKNLMPQILQPRTISLRDSISEGLFLIYWGLFKKVFIADNLGTIISAYENTQDGGVMWASMWLYMFRLYCDFSAYSDIARGTAKLFGFELMLNFRAPYLARNVQEFWQRWHISLTTWIRDYLYYPLVLTRFKKKSLGPNQVVIITFIVMGFWHGASWNYVFWGLYNGLLLAAYATWVPPFVRRHKLNKLGPVLSKVIWGLSIFLCLNFIILGDVFFRFTDMGHVNFYLWNIFTNFSFSAQAMSLYGTLFLYLIPLLIVDILLYRYNDDLQRLFRFPAVLRYLFLYITFYLVVMHPGHTDSFIYFQF